MTGHILRLRLNSIALLPDLAVLALHGDETVVAQVRSGIRGMTRPGYNTTLLEKIWVPVPPLAEQMEMVRRVGEALSGPGERLSTAMTACVARFDSLETAALAKAFRGELVEQDPNDEPASALLARIGAATQQLATAHDARPAHSSSKRTRTKGRAATAL